MNALEPHLCVSFAAATVVVLQLKRPVFVFFSSIMIDLCQWRARIGSWNCCQWSQSRDCTTSNNYCKGTSGTGRGTTTATQLKTPRLILSIFCLIILLFISGDVELNPGPTLTGM